MFNVTTNCYLPEITLINPFIIGFKNVTFPIVMEDIHIQL